MSHPVPEVPPGGLDGCFYAILTQEDLSILLAEVDRLVASRKVGSDRYAFVRNTGAMLLVRPNSHALPPGERVVNIDLREGVDSLVVDREQLTMFGWPAWFLGGVILTLIVQLAVWAVQHFAGRKTTTEFRLKLRDSREISLRADRLVVLQVQGHIARGRAS